MSVELYEHTGYKQFLNAKLDELDGEGRGARSRLSRSIGCQTAYTAQVLRGSAHFSLEQGEAVNDFLGHTEEQGQFFLLLIQAERAGSAKLRGRFLKQIAAARAERALLKNRLEVKAGLGAPEQMTYYSSWLYGAIHALVSVPGFQSAEKIARRLDISTKAAADALEFLQKCGLLERGRGGTLKIGRGQIHLGGDSPLIAKHHINWRLQAIRSLERSPGHGLHYSSVISLSEKDEAQIRDRMIGLLREIKPIIRESKEEEVCGLALDFFRL